MDSKSSRPELLTPAEAAARLGLKPGTLAVWRSTNRYPLPYYRSGRLIRYAAADLDAFLASRRRTHTGESEA